MSRELRHKAVMKFLPAQFPWIDQNVFEAIYPGIQKFSIWPDTEKFS